MHEDQFPLSEWCSSFRYIRLEIPRDEFEMSIAGLGPWDALTRLKEATGELARVERPGVTQTPIHPISTSSDSESLESLDSSQPDSIETLIKQSDALDLANKEACAYPRAPQEALNRLRMKKQAILEKLRQKYLGKARRGMSE